MVNVFPKIALSLAKSFLLVLPKRTDGGMEVATILQADTLQCLAPTVLILGAKMGGVVTRRCPMMVARITKKRGINAPTVTVPMVPTPAKRLPAVILRHILVLIPPASLEHVVDYLQVLRALSLVFLTQQKNATL
jgi:hypothetical protein